MKTGGRPKSKNIDDRRNWSGSDAKSQMTWKSGVHAFYMESIMGASKNRVEGRKIKGKK
jgi:hypothetical protein